MRLGRILGALAAAGWLAAAAASSAYAHAVLVSSLPGDGASVEAPLAQIRLEFSEPVAPVAIRLLDLQGSALESVDVEVLNNTLVVRPRAPLAAGGYFLSYRVTSLDAHPVGATLRFGVGAPAPGAAESGAVPMPSGYLGVAARWLFHVTALSAVGAALFVAIVRAPPQTSRWTRRLVAGLAIAALGGALLRLGVAGLELGGLPWVALFTGEPWAIAAHTTLGVATAVAALGLLVLLSARRSDGLLLLGAVVVASSYGLTGHAATAGPRWLTGPAVSMHAICAAFWIGAFLPLLRSLDVKRADLQRLLQRVSLRATAAVAGLVLTGATLAWIQLGGNVAAMVSTEYGWRLIVKLVLVAALLGIAAVNRWVLTRAIANGAESAVTWLRRTLAVDVVLALAVLAVTATFALSPPPRVSVALEGLTIVASGRGGQATITLLPGRAGANRLEAMVVDRDGLPIVARSAEILWSLPDAGVEPLRIAAQLPLPGVASASPVTMPRAGRWRLRLDLLVDDFTKLTFEGEIELR